MFLFVFHSVCTLYFINTIHISEKDIKVLRKNQIIDLMAKSFDFISKCEKLLIKDRKVNALRGTLTSMGSSYLDEFHKQQMDQIKLLMHSEQWTPEAAVPKSYQDIVMNWIPVNERVTIATEQQEPSTPVTPATAIASMIPEQATTTTTTTSEQCTTLTINGNAFLVSNSLLMMVKILSDYLEMLQQPKFAFINPLDLIGRLYRLLSVCSIVLF